MMADTTKDDALNYTEVATIYAVMELYVNILAQEAKDRFVTMERTRSIVYSIAKILSVTNKLLAMLECEPRSLTTPLLVRVPLYVNRDWVYCPKGCGRHIRRDSVSDTKHVCY